MVNAAPADCPRVTAAEGVIRQVLGDEPASMLVAFTFEQGAVGALHHPPHVRSTFVRSGSFEFTVGDEVHRLEAGDSLVIASGVVHGCRALQPGVPIDGFAPRRDDFLQVSVRWTG